MEGRVSVPLRISPPGSRIFFPERCSKCTALFSLIVRPLRGLRCPSHLWALATMRCLLYLRGSPTFLVFLALHRQAFLASLRHRFRLDCCWCAFRVFVVYLSPFAADNGDPRRINAVPPKAKSRDSTDRPPQLQPNKVYM